MYVSCHTFNDKTNSTILPVVEEQEKCGERIHVLMDTGLVVNFCRNEWAEARGFAKKWHVFSVITVGEVIRRIDSFVYNVELPDTQGRIQRFQALGLEGITAPGQRPLDVWHPVSVSPSTKECRLEQ